LHFCKTSPRNSHHLPPSCCFSRLPEKTAVRWSAPAPLRRSPRHWLWGHKSQWPVSCSDLQWSNWLLRMCGSSGRRCSLSPSCPAG